MAVKVAVPVALADDVLAECARCSWWVLEVDVLAGLCSWCRGWPAGWWGGK